MNKQATARTIRKREADMNGGLDGSTRVTQGERLSRDVTAAAVV